MCKVACNERSDYYVYYTFKTRTLLTILTVANDVTDLIQVITKSVRFKNIFNSKLPKWFMLTNINHSLQLALAVELYSLDI